MSRSWLTAAVPLALLVAVATASCGSSEDEGNDAKANFVSKVYPQIDGSCSSCHATGKQGAPIFMADNAEGSYNAIKATPGYVAPPTMSPLVQKGLHSGPKLTELQEKFVSDWLILEPEGGRGDTSKPTNLRAAFKLFGQCMDYTEWTQLGLNKMAQSVSALGACTSCHSEGFASVWLSNDPAETFSKMGQFPYVQRLVTGNVDDKGHFQRIVDAERLITKGKERPRNGNHHPAFDLGAGINGVVPAEMQQNLRTFVSNTINKMYRINGCASVVKPDAGPDAAR
jgi:hypothetical protein